MKNCNKGKLAEFIARIYMRIYGYHIIERNFITGRGTTAGEIDFIACRGKNLVFVEVKQRQSLELSAYAISNTQKQRIIRGAKSFLKKFPQYQNYNIRFDAILISLPLHVLHIKNAWNE